ncbi:unnamed protein product [Acanthoscelides obtectus]|uniref:Uncharacterized protein n=1 Tax=Acanthoscelides obtectus TaxID=200917 RepID=A0A9P0KBA3_ACAOB|nr:unnamed protein product [Acanthoscelides obtectus]CAK1672651.1 hypothetical protein AOBTE_LOCUS29019 [Acanthoscelides obtectus]
MEVSDLPGWTSLLLRFTTGTSMFISILDQVLGSKEVHEEESTMETGMKLSSEEPGESQE